MSGVGDIMGSFPCCTVIAQLVLTSIPQVERYCYSCSYISWGHFR
jgi:hypothetical protein